MLHLPRGCVSPLSILMILPDAGSEQRGTGRARVRPRRVGAEEEVTEVLPLVALEDRATCPSLPASR